MSRSSSELEKLLWQSAKADAPPSDGAQRLTAALTSRLEGLSPSSAPPEPPCSVPTVVAAGAQSASAWKVFGTVSVLLVPLAATFLLVRSTTSGPVDPPPVMATQVSPASGAIATAAPALAPPNAAEPVPSPVSVLAVDDLPPARTTTTTTTTARTATARRLPMDSAGGARTPAAQAAAPRMGRSSDLDAEVAILDEVRAHLRQGAPARATSLLERYDARFPRGLLQPEAKVLQIEARAAAGDRAAAHDLARSFLVRHPNDPHADRIRELEAQLRP